jgi:hypothetical protein
VSSISANPSPTISPTPPAASAAISLRYWGVLLLMMFLLTSAVGGSLALESSYVLATLVSHIGLALVTLGLAGYGAAVLSRQYQPLPRNEARLAALSALTATIAGVAFYWGGQSNAALYFMEVFAGLGIVTSLLMVVSGGDSGKLAPASTPR